MLTLPGKPVVNFGPAPGLPPPGAFFSAAHLES
jgi:hypothetical protein